MKLANSTFRFFRSTLKVLNFELFLFLFHRFDLKVVKLFFFSFVFCVLQLIRCGNRLDLFFSISALESMLCISYRWIRTLETLNSANNRWSQQNQCINAILSIESNGAHFYHKHWVIPVCVHFVELPSVCVEIGQSSSLQRNQIDIGTWLGKATAKS